jgi:probable dihydroxyacetone kinase regulator
MSTNTKNTMKDSLKKIIQKKPLNKITISDITNDCDISRMTFYYHFKDIYDLVEWCILSDAQATSEGNIARETWEDELKTIFKIARLNKPFYVSLLHSMDRELVERYVFRYAEKVAVRIIDENTREFMLPEENKARLAEYYAHALTGIIVCWAADNMRESPDYIVTYVSALFASGVKDSIKAIAPNVKQYI